MRCFFFIQRKFHNVCFYIKAYIIIVENTDFFSLVCYNLYNRKKHTFFSLILKGLDQVEERNGCSQYHWLGKRNNYIIRKLRRGIIN